MVSDSGLLWPLPVCCLIKVSGVNNVQLIAFYSWRNAAPAIWRTRFLHFVTCSWTKLTSFFVLSARFAMASGQTEVWPQFHGWICKLSLFSILFNWQWQLFLFFCFCCSLWAVGLYKLCEDIWINPPLTCLWRAWSLSLHGSAWLGQMRFLLKRSLTSLVVTFSRS